MILVGIAEDLGLRKIRLLLLLLLRKDVVKLEKFSLNTFIGWNLWEVKIKKTSIQSIRIAFFLLRLVKRQLWFLDRTNISSIYYFIDKIHGINCALCIQPHFSSSHFI